jgi:hypothetical protein
VAPARRHGEQLAGSGDRRGPVAVGQQAGMADAVEAFGQHVHHETPAELMRGSVMAVFRPV